MAVLPGENIDDFHYLAAVFADQSQPASASNGLGLEGTFIRRLGDAEWRTHTLKRFRSQSTA
jgi:hypothetical protein